METLAFSRSLEVNIQIKEDRKFNAILEFARDDDGAVDWTDKVILMEIYDKQGGTLQDTLTSVGSADITIATDTLAFDKTFTDLDVKAYYQKTFNNTDKIGIMHGKLIVI